MEDLLKSGLGLSLHLQKFYLNCLQHSATNQVIDWWAKSPLGEYYCDSAIDLALKMYYWPMYVAGREDQISEWFNRLLMTNLCHTGQLPRPTNQAAAIPDTV